MNVFFVGDELVAGHGDPKALGWSGRVAARTLPHDPDVRFHTLAVPGETTGELTARWDDEALRRLGPGRVGDDPHAVVFAIGHADVHAGVSPSMTRLNIAGMLDRAKALDFRVLLAGPPPGRADDRQHIAELAALCEEAAARRGVGYVDMYGPLARHDQWIADMEQGRDSLPRQAGYGLMAWLVLHAGWFEWLGIERSDTSA